MTLSDVGRPPVAPPELSPPLLGITLPGDVPQGSVVVEYDEGLWRVITYGRPTESFRSREEALQRARAIAAIYSPAWVIVETPHQESRRIA